MIVRWVTVNGVRLPAVLGYLRKEMPGMCPLQKP